MTEPTIDVEAELRYAWWINHGHDGLYGDDGEMQCGRCPADFKRQPLEQLQAAVLKARLERAAEAGPAAKRLRTFHELLEVAAEVVARFDAHGKPAGTIPFPLATSIDKLRRFVGAD